ncbi:hypothetical protein ABPG77_008449 [Micractinium sp. CCAP 211/92]
MAAALVRAPLPLGPAAERRRCLVRSAALPSAVDTASTSGRVNIAGGASNILPAEQLTEGQRRKLELQAQAAAALAADNAWWQDDADAPANFITARTPAEYKALIMGAAPTQLVVVDYLKPSCNACRRLSPKLKQIAASNPETLFIKVNVDTEEMRELGEGMQVAHLPWFHLFLAGDLRASFSANVTSVATLRAEIAANKLCTDPACDVY